MPRYVPGHFAFLVSHTSFAMAGYAGTPLGKKLGIKEGCVMYVLHPPGEYFNWLSPLAKDVQVKVRLEGQFDLIHIFVLAHNDFKQAFVKCQRHLKRDGMLWVSWPKKASKVPTDLDENKIRDYGLQHGLVDVKVCAVDEVWSGLKFVIRIKDR